MFLEDVRGNVAVQIIYGLPLRQQVKSPATSTQNPREKDSGLPDLITTQKPFLVTLHHNDGRKQIFPQNLIYILNS
jgi:hypothetical protein